MKVSVRKATLYADMMSLICNQLLACAINESVNALMVVVSNAVCIDK